MRVLVVDDEPLARRRLIRMLGQMEDVQVAGEAADGQEALERIALLEPDVVLLDIRMPGLDGLSLARTVPNLPPVVFTTAYDEHAVDAFEANAIDYLLKPVKRERLERALSRVRERAGRRESSDVVKALERLLGDRDRTSAPRITAHDNGALHVFDAREIPRFYAQDKYTAFLVEGREYLLEESLSSLERRLEAFDFLRVHRGELVALAQVRAFRPEDAGGVVELRDGQTARVSRRFVPALRKKLGG